MKSAAAIVLAAFIIGGCATEGHNNGPRVVSEPGPQQEAAFGQLKSLKGTWKMDHKADGNGEIVFAVSSNGSIVREIMFPGTPSEMTNVYHLDGPSIVMTHYCAMGNQPRMRATGGGGNEIAFACDGVSNLTSADEMYMGEMTLTFKDKDHVTELWHHFDHGKKSDKPTKIELTRAE